MSVHWAANLNDMEELACGGLVGMALGDGEDVTANWADVDCEDCLDQRLRLDGLREALDREGDH